MKQLERVVTPDSGGCLKHGILVVEDQPPNRELLCDWLELEGYEVRSAADFESSYEAFAERLPTRSTRYQSRWRKWPRPRRMDAPKTGAVGKPRIAVTAHALVTEQLGILQAGCRACLSKPINFQAFENS